MRDRSGRLAAACVAVALAATLPLVLTAEDDAPPAPDKKFGIGRPATAADITSRDFTVLPDGTGLPPGSGTAAQGRSIFADKCAVCHNDNGEGREGQYVALVGGPGPVKTVGNYWPYATTLFDYIRRAMPYDNPRTLSDDQVYSVAAFVLFLNGIVEENQELNARTLPEIRMPNRDGFVPDPRPDVASEDQ